MRWFVFGARVASNLRLSHLFTKERGRGVSVFAMQCRVALAKPRNGLVVFSVFLSLQALVCLIL